MRRNACLLHTNYHLRSELLDNWNATKIMRNTGRQQILILDHLVQRGPRSKAQIVYMVSPTVNHVWLARMELTSLAMGLDSDPSFHSKR